MAPGYIDSSLYPARLDHIRIDSDKPEVLAAFYQDALGMAPVRIVDGAVLMVGAQRRLVIGTGNPGEQPYSAFRLQDERQLTALRSHVAEQGIPMSASDSPLFSQDSFSVRDPDGRSLVFGLARPEYENLRLGGHLKARELPARLQHVVVATSQLAKCVEFYESLGFMPSDYVYAEEAGAKAMVAAFWRSDQEHHSFAAFRAPKPSPDHHCYEVTSWNDIRDWADHLATLEIKLWWGPGRHGPGNNLFFMIQDPNGYKIELSSELEVVPREMQPRTWKHDWKASNLWGPSWFRS